eukprot:561006-Amphidinium_carterae.1
MAFNFVVHEEQSFAMETSNCDTPSATPSIIGEACAAKIVDGAFQPFDHSLVQARKISKDVKGPSTASPPPNFHDHI